MKAFCSVTERNLSAPLQAPKLDSQQHKRFKAFPARTPSARYISKIRSLERLPHGGSTKTRQSKRHVPAVPHAGREDAPGQPGGLGAGRREKCPDFIQNKTRLPGKLRILPPLQLCQVSFQVKRCTEQIFLLKWKHGSPSRGESNCSSSPTHPEESKSCRKFFPLKKPEDSKSRKSRFKI